jgi:hypothetical protein
MPGGCIRDRRHFYPDAKKKKSELRPRRFRKRGAPLSVRRSVFLTTIWLAGGCGSGVVEEGTFLPAISTEWKNVWELDPGNSRTGTFQHYPLSGRSFCQEFDCRFADWHLRRRLPMQIFVTRRNARLGRMLFDDRKFSGHT